MSGTYRRFEVLTDARPSGQEAPVRIKFFNTLLGNESCFEPKCTAHDGFDAKPYTVLSAADRS